MPHPDEDDLALLALGESRPALEAHVRTCPACAAELVSLRATVATVRDAELTPLPPPPAGVWDRVRDELGLVDGEGAPAPSSARAPRAGRRRAVVASLLTAAAAVVAVVVVTGAVTPGSSAPAASELQAVGDVDATGSVVVTDGADRRSLLVDTSGLPAAVDADYEVWLLDLDGDRLVTLGVLDAEGRAWVSLPDDVELDDWPLVDVSLEPADGDPGHSGDSVLRGDVPT